MRKEAAVALTAVIGIAGAAPAVAQNYQPPPDPRQFCYYNGQPYSMGSPYPGNTPGPRGRPMRCDTSDAPVNGYIMLEWSDAN